MSSLRLFHISVTLWRCSALSVCNLRTIFSPCRLLLLLDDLLDETSLPLGAIMVHRWVNFCSSDHWWGFYRYMRVLSINYVIEIIYQTFKLIMSGLQDEKKAIRVWNSKQYLYYTSLKYLLNARHTCRCAVIEASYRSSEWSNGTVACEWQHSQTEDSR